MKTVGINKFQFFAIVYSYIVANDIIRGFYALELRFDLWAPISASILLSCLVFFIYSFIYKNNNYNDFQTSIENIVGKFLSKVLFLLYAVYFILLLFYNIRDLVELTIMYLVRQGRIFLVGLGFLVVILYIIKQGVKPFARYSTFVLFGTVSSFLFFSTLIYSFNDVEFMNIFPIFAHGIKPLIKPTFTMTYGVPMGELFALLLIYQFLDHKEKKKGFKSGYLAILSGGFLLLTLTLMNIVILNPEAMTYGLNPSLRVWRRVDNDRFIQRFDLIVLCIVTLHCIIKQTVLAFATKHMITRVVKIKKANLITILIAIAIFAGLYFYGRKYPQMFIFRVEVFVPYINAVFEIGIPFLLVLLSFFRKKKAKPNPNLEGTENFVNQTELEF